MKEHVSFYWPLYALFLVIVVAVGGLAVLAEHSQRHMERIAQECGRAGGMRLAAAKYDYYGTPSSYYCLNHEGQPIDVPEWR